MPMNQKSCGCFRSKEILTSGDILVLCYRYGVSEALFGLAVLSAPPKYLTMSMQLRAGNTACRSYWLLDHDNAFNILLSRKQCFPHDFFEALYKCGGPQSWTDSLDSSLASHMSRYWIAQFKHSAAVRHPPVASGLWQTI